MSELKYYLVRFYDDSFMLISGKSRIEILKRIDHVCDPGSCIVKLLTEPIALEIERSVHPCGRYSRMFIDPSTIPTFDFSDICLKKKYSDVEIVCNDGNLPGHACILSKYPQFKEELEKSDKIEMFSTCFEFQARTILTWLYNPQMEISELINGREEYEKNDSLENKLSLLRITNQLKFETLHLLLTSYFARNMFMNTLIPVQVAFNPFYNNEMEQKAQEKLEREVEWPKTISNIMDLYNTTKNDPFLTEFTRLIVGFLKCKCSEGWKKDLLPPEIRSILSEKHRFYPEEITSKKSKRRNSKLEYLSSGPEFKFGHSGLWTDDTFKVINKHLFPSLYRYEEHVSQMEVEEKQIDPDKKREMFQNAWKKEKKRIYEHYEKNKKAAKRKLKNAVGLMERFDCNCPELIHHKLTNPGLDLNSPFLMDDMRWATLPAQAKHVTKKELMRMERKCVNCEDFGSLMCSRCKKVYYCSVKCQKRDWKRHKKSCKKKKKKK